MQAAGSLELDSPHVVTSPEQVKQKGLPYSVDFRSPLKSEEPVSFLTRPKLTQGVSSCAGSVDSPLEEKGQRCERFDHRLLSDH